MLKDDLGFARHLVMIHNGPFGCWKVKAQM